MDGLVIAAIVGYCVMIIVMGGAILAASPYEPEFIDALLVMMLAVAWPVILPAYAMLLVGRLFRSWR